MPAKRKGRKGKEDGRKAVSWTESIASCCHKEAQVSMYTRAYASQSLFAEGCYGPFKRLCFLWLSTSRNAMGFLAVSRA